MDRNNNLVLKKVTVTGGSVSFIMISAKPWRPREVVANAKRRGETDYL